MSRACHCKWACLFIALCLSAPLIAAESTATQEVLPVPKALEQGKVDRPLRDKYKAEFASRDPKERGALGRKLREAAEAEKDSTARFVLLKEARDLAIDAGDLPFCMEVIDAMAKGFMIDPAEMKANSLSVALDKSRADPETLFNTYLKVADDCLVIWDLDLAGKSAYMASKLAARNRHWLAAAKEREDIVRHRKTEFTVANTAYKKLARTPDDPQANQLVGRHICFNLNHWDAGLPYLAKSASETLKALAERDLAALTDPAAMAALADAWWDFSDVKLNIPAGAGHRRAAYWYAKALPGLCGGKKAEAEKRIAETNVRTQ
jgi:hypothetical protein